MKLEPELRDMFMAEAAAVDRPAAQVMRELMRGFIEQRHQTREYDEYLRRKIEVARADKATGRDFPNEEIEAEFSAARNELLQQAHA
jgi:hypothetical protein